MARKCPSCNKFASIDDGADVSVESEDISGSDLTVEITVPLVSQCCGETMAEQTMEAVIDLDQIHDDCPKADQQEDCSECGGSGLIEPPEGSETEESEECPNCGGSGRVDLDDLDPEDRYEVVGNVDAVFTSDTERTFRKGKKAGKPIPNPRYWTTLYGAELTAEVRCNWCDQTFEVLHTETAPASTFESY